MVSFFPHLFIVPTFLSSPVCALGPWSFPTRWYSPGLLRSPRERKRNNCEQILREMCSVGVQQTSVRVVGEDTPLLPEGWRGGRWSGAGPGTTRPGFHASSALAFLRLCPFFPWEGEATPCVSCATLAKSPHFSELQLPSLQNGDNNPSRAHLVDLLPKSDES